MFGTILKQLRIEHGYSLEHLGKLLGVGRSTVNMWESGKRVPRVPMMEQVADLFNVDMAYLLGKTTVRNAYQLSLQASKVPEGFDPLPATKLVPLVGQIACGKPITAEENIEQYVSAPAEYNADFVLRCHGDSMIDVGIVEGDLVYIKSQPEVENGQIAAVLIDGEATLKRFYRSGNVVTLVAENRAYPPIVLTGSQLDELTIEGRAVGFSHYF